MTTQPDLSPAHRGGDPRRRAALGRLSYLGEHADVRRKIGYRRDSLAAALAHGDERQARHETACIDRFEAELATLGPEAPVTFGLRMIRLNSGAYDSGGAYWGAGAPVYWAGSDCGEVEMWFRAADRTSAKAHVCESFPTARFAR